jgi:ribosomal protein L33
MLCNHCGHPNENRFQFCVHCGQPLQPGDASTTSAPVYIAQASPRPQPPPRQVTQPPPPAITRATIKSFFSEPSNGFLLVVLLLGAVSLLWENWKNNYDNNRFFDHLQTYKTYLVATIILLTSILVLGVVYARHKIMRFCIALIALLFIGTEVYMYLEQSKKLDQEKLEFKKYDNKKSDD